MKIEILHIKFYDFWVAHGRILLNDAKKYDIDKYENEENTFIRDVFDFELLL